MSRPLPPVRPPPSRRIVLGTLWASKFQITSWRSTLIHLQVGETVSAENRRSGRASLGFQVRSEHGYTLRQCPLQPYLEHRGKRIGKGESARAGADGRKSRYGAQPRAGKVPINLSST